MHKFLKISATAVVLALSSFGASAIVAVSSFNFYTSEAAFTSATGLSAFESFEALAGSSRSANPVVVSGFTVVPVGLALLGVQVGAETPETGNGASATHGSNYLLSYLPNQPTGSLRFDFNTPVTAFGLHVIDAGEAAGDIIVQTNSGESSTPFAAFSFTNLTLQPNGNVLFLGFSQSTSFTSLTLTVNGVDDSYGLDKVYVQSVPEPGQWATLLAGLLSVFGVVRRRLGR